MKLGRHNKEKFGYKPPDVRDIPGITPFEKGNRAAAYENMSEESHRRRKRGLFRAWAVSARKHKGENIMTAKEIKVKERRVRERLRDNVAAESREIQNLARQHAVEGMQILAELARDETIQPTARIAAIALIHERAYGKATQVNANIDANGKPTEVTGKELDTRIAEALKRVENLTTGTPQETTSEARPADVCDSDRDSGGSSLH